MKIRQILVTLCMISCISGMVLYTQATQPLHPKDMILNSIKNADTAQLIRELISHMKESLEKDRDHFPELIAEVDSFNRTVSDPAMQAILHSMLAQMYKTYYQSQGWMINQRTSLEGYVPEDIREWSANLFQAKMKEELERSLQPAGVLQQTPVSRFREILEPGEDSPELRPTLYDFLAYRAVMIQPSEEIYRQLIGFRKSQPERKALLLAELEYLSYLQDSPDRYERQTDSLLQVYAGEDISVEIVMKKLENLNQQMWRSGNRDSIRALQYALSQETISRFPAYDRIGLIRNFLQQMEHPVLNVSTPATVYPGDLLKIDLNYTHIENIQVSVYESGKTPEDLFLERSDRKASLQEHGRLVYQQTYPLSSLNTYTPADTALFIPVPSSGVYECVITAREGEIETTNVFSISRLAALHRDTPGGKLEVLVTDLKSGKPQANATVAYDHWTQRQLKKAGSIRTDRDGIAVFPELAGSYAYHAVLAGDSSMLLTSIARYGDRPEQETGSQETLLLTDRGIYRPGQTVCFKGIQYVPDRNHPRVLPGRTTEISLRDPNNKVVATQTFTTNNFGSFHGEFTLPSQGLTGHYLLTTDGNTSLSFRVEEYKRPTFRIDFSPVTEEIRFGDRVTLTGKAQTFSGVELQSGQATYRITRRYWLTGRMAPGYTEQVAEGSTSLLPDGTFAIGFQPERSTIAPTSPQVYTYDISVMVTDSKGETQETNYAVSVGDKRLVLSTTLTDLEEKEKASPLIRVATINDQPVDVQGTYTIFSLEETGGQETLNVGKVVATGIFDSNQILPASVFSGLPSGRIRICLEAEDSSGEKVEYQQELVLYSRKDARPPVSTPVWLPETSSRIAAGQTAEVYFGTSEKEAAVLYEIFDGKQLVSREWITLANENRIFRVPFRETYGDWLNVVFTLVKEGKAYSRVFTVNREYPDRELTIKAETFRDRLQPGSYEHWTFRIRNADSVPVVAEVVAGMYDASLDQFLPFRWHPSFEKYHYNYTFLYMFQEGNGLHPRSSGDQLWNPAVVPDFRFDRLNWQGVMEDMFTRGGTGVVSTRNMMMKAAMPESMDMVQQELAEEPVAIYSQADAAGGTTDQTVHPGAGSLSPIRTNFQETAFFYPALQTDPEGNLVISFTVPESNTAWKFQSLAHTTDLAYGLFSEEVLTQKPLMVLPNLPRFVRQGDVVSFTTQIMNQSDKEISGLSRIELFDPVTTAPVLCLTKSQFPFTLEPGKTISTSWQVPVPAGIELLGIRILADSDTASDGEQHLLPVLPDEIIVTESTPFYLTEAGEHLVEISRNNRSVTRRPLQMTLEISSNPVWYAVQALPVLTQPKQEDVLSWFASYYSHTLAGYLVHTVPRLQQVIQAWTVQGGDMHTLYSNLEKNEELKNILLEETPWVLEAAHETEQKQRLALLFDLNRSVHQREVALRELEALQHPSGAWGWFKGFYPNRWMTIYILKRMGELVEMGAMQSGETEKRMQILALKYLDTCMQEDYEALLKQKKDLKKVIPTYEQLDYLYMRSFYRDLPEPESAREAIRFYTQLAGNTWEKASLYGKAATGILMYRLGNRQVADAILSWFRKTATRSPEMGMYWANNRRDTDFFVSPVEVHTMILALFREASPDQGETDAMKQWLLNQKRTQQWDSALSTMGAIYSLLLTGSDWLNEPNRITVRWGEYTADTAEGETATGYIQETIPGNGITTGMEQLNIHKEGTAPAWGAVYSQYLEPIRETEKTGGALRVDKQLFRETNSGTGRQLSPVTGEKPLQPGDKVVVRLTIRTDREMEFVHLKDLRAGCFEPSVQLSGFRYRESLMYYQISKDLSENFFFERLPVGTFVLEYPVYVARAGEYSGGISTIQCLYAPEFVSHTEGDIILVQE